MKKFSFSLETVRTFKGQILDNLQNELAIIFEEVKLQEQVILNVETDIKNLNDEYNSKNKIGMNILEIRTYKSYQKTLYAKLEKEHIKLEKIKEDEETKRNEVVESKKENMSLDMLKEKKLEEYNVLLKKNEELFIEEFVVNNLSIKNA